MLLLLLSLLVASGCAHQITPTSSGEVALHFCHLTNCSAVLTTLVGHAASVSCAFYTLDGPLQQTLLASGAKLVVDEDAHLSLPTRYGAGLMHDKFCIINDSIVATGSYNPSTKENYDNLLVIYSAPLAEQFQESFDQLLEKKKQPSSQTVFVHNGFLIESYACPQDQCHDALLKALSSANKSIRFALFTFTDPAVADILVEKKQQGLFIQGVMESYQSKTYSKYGQLKDAGISVSLERSQRLQHNKLFVIDGSIVVMGSYNPTKAAYTINDEHLLILHDAPVAKAYDDLITAILNDTQSFK